MKNPDPLINYCYSGPMTIQEDVFGIENLNFHIPTLLQEVRQLPKKTLKIYKQQIRVFLATATTFLILPLKSMASTIQGVQSVPTTGVKLPTTVEGMPPELVALLLKLLVISVGSALIFAAILLVAAGLRRMIGQKKDASEMTTNIIKGLIQVLIAAPTVYLIYYVVNLLLGGSGWFVSPF